MQITTVVAFFTFFGKSSATMSVSRRPQASSGLVHAIGVFVLSCIRSLSELRPSIIPRPSPLPMMYTRRRVRDALSCLISNYNVPYYPRSVRDETLNTDTMIVNMYTSSIFPRRRIPLHHALMCRHLLADLGIANVMCRPMTHNRFLQDYLGETSEYLG